MSRNRSRAIDSENEKREIASSVPVIAVVASAAVLVVLFAVFEVALGVVVVGHVVVFVLVELVVLELLDVVVVRVLLLALLVVGVVFVFLGVVEVGQLVARGSGVDFEGLLARVRVFAFAFGVDDIPELFREVFLFCALLLAQCEQSF